MLAVFGSARWLVSCRGRPESAIGAARLGCGNRRMFGSSVQSAGEKGLVDDARITFKGRTGKGGANEGMVLMQAARTEIAGRRPKCKGRSVRARVCAHGQNCRYFSMPSGYWADLVK